MTRSPTNLTLDPAVDDLAKNQVSLTVAPTLLVGRAEAARLCGISTPTWDRMTASGKTPESIHLGGRILWCRADLEAWIGLGCPNRKTFSKIK